MAPLALPGRIVGTYFTLWTGSPRITDVPLTYNLIYLFHTIFNADGSVRFEYPGAVTAAEVATCKSRGQRCVLTCGGANAGFNFSNRTQSTAFVNSFAALNASHFGGELDGCDFNNFEAFVGSSGTEMAWIGLELKRRFGANFSISCPPHPGAGYAPMDRAITKAMSDAGALDYAAPQFYDSPDLTNPSLIVQLVNEWVVHLGAASKVVVGMGSSYGGGSSTAQSVQAWNTLEAQHPSLRGVFGWSQQDDRNAGYPWANALSPLVLDGTAPPPPPPVDPPAKIATLVEPFNSGAAWGVTGQASIANSRATLQCLNSMSRLESSKVYDLTGSSLYMQLSQLPRQGARDTALNAAGSSYLGSSEAGLWLYNSDDDYVLAIVTGGRLFCRVRDSGVNTQTSIAWDPTRPFVRVREASATVVIEHSADAQTWHTVLSTPHSMAAELASVRVRLECWYWDAAELDPPLGYLTVEGLNVAVPSTTVAIPPEGSTPPPPPPGPSNKVGILVEPFDASTGWRQVQAVGGSITSGKLTIPATPAYAGWETVVVYDATESAIYAEISAVPVQSATLYPQGEWALIYDQQNFVNFLFETQDPGGAHIINCQLRVNDVYSHDPAPTPYDPAYDYYRYVESAGVMQFQRAVSASGPWQTLRTVTHGLGDKLTSVRPTFYAGYYGSGGGSPGNLIVEGVNVSTAAPPVVARPRFYTVV